MQPRHISECDQAVKIKGFVFRKQELSRPKAQFRPAKRSLFPSNVKLKLEKKQILAVHHHSDTLSLIAEMFAKLGNHQITTATNSLKAFQHIGQRRFDLVFSDFDMPLLNGYLLGRLIKKKYPQTKTVVMTCRCQAELVELMADGTIDGWLFKPFKIDAIGDLLTDLGMVA